MNRADDSREQPTEEPKPISQPTRRQTSSEGTPHASGGPAESETADTRCRAMLDAAHEIILKFDMTGRITFVNQGGLDITGYVEEELLGMNVADILPPDQLEQIRTRLFDPSGRGHKEVDLYEAHFINRELALIPVEINAVVIMAGSQPSEVLFIARDITDRKRRASSESRERMFDLLETLSAGMADDLNNLFTPVLGHIDLAMGEPRSEDRLRQLLSEARKGCRKVREFIGSLALFSAADMPQAVSRSVSGLVSQVAEASVDKARFRCEIAMPDDLWPVVCDKAQMEQVFRSLLANAADAMPSGGKIKITGENMVLGPHDSPVAGRALTGKYIKISVQDEGRGIPAEYLDRIFDPYFSTKSGRRGLGLSQMYAIVRHHGGHVEVRSKPGRTIFLIYLPFSEQTPRKEATAPLPSGRPRLKGRVLIMDDEEIVREVATHMLARLGYEAAVACEGAEAVALYKKAMESGGSFDAVILDLNVKDGMGGHPAIQELLRVDPNVKGIVSSGYSNDPEMTDFRKHGFCGSVEKPYNIKELSAILQKVVASR